MFLRILFHPYDFQCFKFKKTTEVFFKSKKFNYKCGPNVIFRSLEDLQIEPNV